MRFLRNNLTAIFGGRNKPIAFIRCGIFCCRDAMDRFLLPPASVRRRDEILVAVTGHLAGRSTPEVIPK